MDVEPTLVVGGHSGRTRRGRPPYSAFARSIGIGPEIGEELVATDTAVARDREEGEGLTRFPTPEQALLGQPARLKPREN